MLVGYRPFICWFISIRVTLPFPSIELKFRLAIADYVTACDRQDRNTVNNPVAMRINCKTPNPHHEVTGIGTLLGS